MTSPVEFNLQPYIDQVRNTELLPWSGEVVELVGTLVASRGPSAAIGEFCEVHSSSGRRIRTCSRIWACFSLFLCIMHARAIGYRELRTFPLRRSPAESHCARLRAPEK